MKTNPQSLRRKMLALGVLLLVSGVLMPVLGIKIPSLATVIYDATPPAIGTTYPAGTSGAPTGLTPGGAITITAICTDNIVASTDLNVKVTVTWSGGSSGVLQMVPEVIGSIYQKHYVSWTVPNLPSTTFTFSFSATDYSGNTGTKTTYGVTGSPTGDFYINGQKVTASSVIYVSSGALNFKVTATSMQSYVADVVITVTKSTSTATLTYTGGQLSKSGNDYTCSYSLAWGEGTYTITSQLKDSAGNFFTLSVLTMNFGEVPILPPLPNLLEYINLLTVSGAVICVYVERDRLIRALK